MNASLTEQVARLDAAADSIQEVRANLQGDLGIEITELALLKQIANGVGGSSTLSTLRRMSLTGGATWDTLPSVAGTTVSILNNTWAALNVSTDAGSNYVVIADGAAVAVQVVANANEIKLNGSATVNLVNLVIN